MNIDKVITDVFKKRINKAVFEAEKKTGGEIVVYIAEQSDSYRHVYWQISFFTFFFISLILFFLNQFYQLPGLYGLLIFGFLLLIPIFVFCIFVCITPLRLFLTEKEEIDYFVNLKAKETFLNEEIFKTKDRTGILLYISLFEKRVVVLGDSGINKKVKKEKWNIVIQTIIKGILIDSLLDGIISGITLCENILKENRIKKRSVDKNELKNNLRIGRKK